MTESPGAEEARRIVDDLEESIVDVDQAQRDAGVDDEDIARRGEDRADDRAEEVPGSPEPAD